ncbi:MAG: catalase family protein [Burkholderiaceae bacterium]|nr:catalase family protein [Burkholderiaceae bacterium]
MTQMKLAQENPPPDEAAKIADLTARLQDKIAKQYAGGLMRRDAHPKMHGVVKAEFTVEPGLAGEWRIGVFREPRTYQAWIRFSNQNAEIQSDLKGDIRGMAIKLIGVSGAKLLDPEQLCETHDFILISTPKFVTHDVAEFDALVKAMMAGMLQTVWFFVTHLRAFWNLVSAMKKPSSPLAIRYWSPTPYLFGTMAVKYSAKPSVPVEDCIPAGAGPDYLRQAMVEQLGRGEVSFDFLVQKQLDAEAMPIEDPGVEWSETLSPFHKLATIRILKQEFDSAEQREFGENLSYNPWRCLAEHRPLGGINRARRIVYDAISRFRHGHNHVPQVEPTKW